MFSEALCLCSALTSVCRGSAVLLRRSCWIQLFLQRNRDAVWTAAQRPVLLIQFIIAWICLSYPLYLIQNKRATRLVINSVTQARVSLAQSQTTPYPLPLHTPPPWRSELRGVTLSAQRGSLLSDGGGKYSGKLWVKLPSLRQKQEMP